jgi:hypothetical protein
MGPVEDWVRAMAAEERTRMTNVRELRDLVFIEIGEAQDQQSGDSSFSANHPAGTRLRHKLKAVPLECTQFDAGSAEDVAAGEGDFYNEDSPELEKKVCLTAKD